MSNWIKVTDRLPEIDNRHGMSKAVLTCTLVGIRANYEVKYYDHELKRWSGHSFYEVTHWMPLPEKPTE